MGDIVSIESQKPHKTGEAICMSCKEEWIAVAPAGVVWLECPKCKTEHGLFKFPCSYSDKSHWECNCGNDLFHVTPDGYYCPNCGSWAEGF